VHLDIYVTAPLGLWLLPEAHNMKKKLFLLQSKSLLRQNITTVFYLEDFYNKMENKLTKHVT